MDTESLRKFLIDSNMAGYAGGDEKKWIKEPDGSTTINFAQGEFKSNDNFFGGEPYGGRIVVHQNNKPVWMMVYYGWVLDGIDPDPVYGMLRNALKQMPEDAPFRGPTELVEGEMVYRNEWDGDVVRYQGKETITQGTKIIYEASYMGGLVDKRVAT